MTQPLLDERGLDAAVQEARAHLNAEYQSDHDRRKASGGFLVPAYVYGDDEGDVLGLDGQVDLRRLAVAIVTAYLEAVAI